MAAAVAGFLEGLKRAFARGKLDFHGVLAHLAAIDWFEQLIDQAVRQDWVVYAKRAFGGPESVRKYLARYTHRVAISNGRLVALRNGRVTFRWKDYAQNGRQRTMTLAAMEFIRRFLLHVLPGGFMKIRHHGFLANRCRAAKRQLCCRLLNVSTAPPLPDEGRAGLPPDAEREPALHLCPHCREGRLRIVAQLLPQLCARRINERAPSYFDSS